MNYEVVEFFLQNLRKEEFQNKKVLEIGSKNVNGSLRPIIERLLDPKEYIGIDIEEGKGVDLVLPVEKLTNIFKEETFDVIICTEVIEHVRKWRLVIIH